MYPYMPVVAIRQSPWGHRLPPSELLKIFVRAAGRVQEAYEFSVKAEEVKPHPFGIALLDPTRTAFSTPIGQRVLGTVAFEEHGDKQCPLALELADAQDLTAAPHRSSRIGCGLEHPSCTWGVSDHYQKVAAGLSGLQGFRAGGLLRQMLIEVTVDILLRLDITEHARFALLPSDEGRRHPLSEYTAVCNQEPLLASDSANTAAYASG